jgi:hypothetical protein
MSIGISLSRFTNFSYISIPPIRTALLGGGDDTGPEKTKGIDQYVLHLPTSYQILNAKITTATTINVTSISPAPPESYAYAFLRQPDSTHNYRTLIPYIEYCC